MTGGTVGKSLLVEILNEDSFINQRIALVRPFILNNYYLNVFIKSPYLLKLISSSKTSTNDNISMKTIEDFLIPLPPLEEQKRIVEKIEELEPYIKKYDSLEKQLTKLENEITDKLKKSILQYAIQGKLVKQDPNDEPASVLLERIKAEKEKLIKEGKIKRDKNESFIYQGDDKNYYENINGKVVNITDEIPFDIPDNWCWCRLGFLFKHNTGKALNSSNTKGLKMAYITTSNLYWNKFELDNLKEMFFTNEEIDKCSVIKGDLLVCEGGDIGRSAIWKYDYSMRIQNHIHRLRPYYDLSVEFYYNVLFLYKNSGLIGGKGIGIQGLSSNSIHNLIIPLPLYNEQVNIVNKINRIIGFLNN